MFLWSLIRIFSDHTWLYEMLDVYGPGCKYRCSGFPRGLESIEL